VHLTAHLVVPDAAAASEWYARAFGAVEHNRVPLPDGKIMTAELVLGDSALSVASEFPQAGILSPLSVGGTSTVLQINTDDADALWAQALAAGGQVRHELADQFWGERHGQLSDPFGHNWNIAQHILDVSPEELNAAAARAFGGNA
jgi:PhnB protein